MTLRLQKVILTRIQLLQSEMNAVTDRLQSEKDEYIVLSVTPWMMMQEQAVASESTLE